MERMENDLRQSGCCLYIYQMVEVGGVQVSAEGSRENNRGCKKELA